MLPSAGKIKKTAKEILSQNHFLSVVACMPFVFSLAVVMLIENILSAVTNYYVSLAVIVLAVILIELPLLLGTIRYFSLSVENVIGYPSAVFYYFESKSKYFASVYFIGFLLLRLAVSMFLFSVPAAVVGVFAQASFYETIGLPIPLWTPILSTVSSIIGILAFIVFFLVNLKYYLSPYLFVICDGISPRKAMKQSVVISRRTQIDFIYLFFSMFIYILLSMFFLPLLFTLPIISVVYVIHSKCAVLQYNLTIDSLKAKSNGFV